MPKDFPESSPSLEIKKYPNRRYYDATRSKHVTLEQIHELIIGGRDVRVTDSKTGHDITGKVLVQIILDHDPVKLGVFPSELLHKIIRSNEVLVKDFVEKYFNQALQAFLESRRQFDDYLRRVVGLGDEASSGQALPPQAFMSSVAASWFSQQAGRSPEPADGEAVELRKMVEELRQQVAALTADRTD